MPEPAHTWGGTGRCTVFQNCLWCWNKTFPFQLFFFKTSSMCKSSEEWASSGTLGTGPGASSGTYGTGPRASSGILGHPHAQYIEVKIMPSVVYCNNTVLAQKIQISRQKNQFFFQKIWSYEYSAWWELRFDTSYIVKSWTLFNCIMNPQIRPLCDGGGGRAAGKVSIFSNVLYHVWN